jgi:hypothetical protein
MIDINLTETAYYELPCVPKIREIKLNLQQSKVLQSFLTNISSFVHDCQPKSPELPTKYCMWVDAFLRGKRREKGKLHWSERTVGLC